MKKKSKKPYWIFMEYDDQKKDYPHNPYSKKTFYNYINMKIWSGKMSHNTKRFHTDYCSDYIKIEDI